MLLTKYGYNLNTMSYENVSAENISKVKALDTSIMGIGWPLRAMFGIVIFLPYHFIIFPLKYIIDAIIKEA